MPHPCAEFEAQLQAALAGLQAIQSGHDADGGAASPADLGQRSLASFRRLDSAKQAYRTAVRNLAECRGAAPVEPAGSAP